MDHGTSQPLHYSKHGEFLQHVPLFEGLLEEDYAQIAALLQLKHYRKNEVIFHANDPGSGLFLLKLGMVKISVESSDRRELVVRLLHPPDFFGEMALLDNLPRSATVTAIEPSEALLLDREDFVTFVQHNPTLLPKMAEALSRRLRKANELVHSLAFMDAYAKVARVLLDLAEARGEATGDAGTAQLRLTQRQLTEYTGMARGTVARVLSDFRQAGYVNISGGYITILEPTLLAHRTTQT